MFSFSQKRATSSLLDNIDEYVLVKPGDTLTINLNEFSLLPKHKFDSRNDIRYYLWFRKGLNRQIRRMCEYLEYEVTKLKRTRIMNVDLGYLQAGDWRELTEEEMKEINAMISTSSKTQEASPVKEKPKQQVSKKKQAPSKNDFNRKSASFRKSSPKSQRANSGFSSKRKRR